MRITAALLMLSLTCHGMGFWEALGMQESGDDDRAVGPQREVSRFQILPQVWKANSRYDLNPTNHADALEVGQCIMAHRVEQFRDSHHREPTSLEMALLWKCPSRVDHPTREKLEQAQRVVNLMGRP